MHNALSILPELKIPEHNTIALALDFSKDDYKIISHAIGQGNTSTKFVLIHIVESASAKILGNESDDFETQKTKLNLIRMQTN